jgi:uncharacterized protein
VAAFGAFVDIGVHQDGLVHVSALSKNFVKDPREVVKSGDIVRVKVLDVDIPRKRISLTLRLDDDAQAGSSGGGERGPRRERGERGDRGERGAQGGGQRGGQQRGQGGQGQRGGQGGQGQRGGQGGQGGGGQRGGQGQGQRGGDRRPPAPRDGGGAINSAMADALRRAGLAK